MYTSRPEIEHFDAITTAGKQTVFEFFAGAQGFHCSTGAARSFIQVGLRLGHNSIWVTACELNTRSASRY